MEAKGESTASKLKPNKQQSSGRPKKFTQLTLQTPNWGTHADPRNSPKKFTQLTQAMQPKKCKQAEELKFTQWQNNTAKLRLCDHQARKKHTQMELLREEDRPSSQMWSWNLAMAPLPSKQPETEGPWGNCRPSNRGGPLGKQPENSGGLWRRSRNRAAGKQAWLQKTSSS